MTSFLSSTARPILSRIPTALFPIALGLAGSGAAARAAASHFGIGPGVALGLLLLTLAAVLLVADIILYLAKLLGAWSAATADFGEATRANLVAPAFMAAMVISTQLGGEGAVGRWLWLGAALGHLFLLMRFFGRWLVRDFAPESLNPTWFLPAAGLMTGSMTAQGHWPLQLTWLIFATGAVLWIGLFPLVLRRLIFEPSVAPPLRPTLFIIAAPFGLASNSMWNVSAETPAVLPAVLAYFGAFVIAAILSRPSFLSGAGVSLSWWSTTFPVAAVATAFFALARRTGSPIDAGVGLALTGLALGFTGLAVAATVRIGWRSRLGLAMDAERQIKAMQGRT